MKFLKNLFTQDANKFQFKRDNLFLKNYDVKIVILKWFCTLVPIMIYIFSVLNLTFINMKYINESKKTILVFSWLNLILTPLFCVNIIYDKTLNTEIKYSLLIIIIMNIISSILNISLWSGKNEEKEDDYEIYEIPPNMSMSIKIITMLSWLTFISYPLIIWISLYFYEPSCREYNLRTLKNQKNLKDIPGLEDL